MTSCHKYRGTHLAQTPPAFSFHSGYTAGSIYPNPSQSTKTNPFSLIAFQRLSTTRPNFDIAGYGEEYLGTTIKHTCCDDQQNDSD